MSLEEGSFSCAEKNVLRFMEWNEFVFVFLSSRIDNFSMYENDEESKQPFMSFAVILSSFTFCSCTKSNRNDN